MSNINQEDIARKPEETEKEELDAILAKVKEPRIFLQPIVNIETGESYGYEALTRGPLGTVIANKTPFIMAEKYHLTRDLDKIVLEKIFELLPKMPPGPIFINCILSNLSLFRKLVENFGDKERPIVIEIDFSAVLVDIKKALDEIRLLAKFPNITFAVDDVGKYNLDQNLCKLIKPKYLKVDISITKKLPFESHEKETFREIDNLAKEINAHLIFEGVETQNVVDYLKIEKHIYVQGFYYCKPKEYHEFTEELKKAS